MSQLALTPAQQTQLLTELADAGPEAAPLRAAIANGVAPVTPDLLSLLGELAAAAPETWQPVYRAGCTLLITDG